MIRKRTSYITPDDCVFQDADQARAYIVDKLCDIVSGLLPPLDAKFNMAMRRAIVLSLVGTIAQAQRLNRILGDWVGGADESIMESEEPDADE